VTLVRVSFLPLAAIIGLSLSPNVRADSTVVFNEIMYHPLTNEAAWEWIELRNQQAVDMDISGWSLAGGVEFTFPEGTIVPGGGYLVVASSPADLMSASGLTNVVGPFTGRLANAGETLELRNNNQRVMDAVSYDVDGDWPVGADGAGPSLAKFDEDGAGDKGRYWRLSEQSGGTPGAPNFPPRITTITSLKAVAFDSAWRFNASGTDPGSAWRTNSYDDGSWSSGAGLFYAGTMPPGETQAIPTLFSSGVGANGAVLVAGALDPHYLLTASAYSTPPPPDIAATVMTSHPAWVANDASSMWIGPLSQGTTSVPPGRYSFRTTFDLTGFNPATALLDLQVAVDNELTNVTFNGAVASVRYSNFNAFSSVFPLTNGFVAGTNTLDFTMANITTSPSPGGLRVKAGGTASRYVPTNTPLALGPTTYYFRKAFVFNGNPATTALLLRSIVDDGAAFYLNGAEIFRQNLPAGPLDYTNLATVNIGTAGFTGPINLSNAGLQTGTNVLAVEVHQAFGGGTDVLFGAEITLQTTNLPPVPLPRVACNEMSLATNGTFWVELLNDGADSAPLDGLVLARFGNPTNAEYVLPAQTLPPGERLVLDQATIGFGADPGDRVILYAPGKTAVLDGVVAKSFPRARWPEGTGEWLHPYLPTPGATNSVAFHDEIVINEIMYHHRDLTNGLASPESWVELFNRSRDAVNLTGWRLDEGIGYGFPTGTVLAAGEYLVVAKDAAYLSASHPGVNILGNFAGQLSKSGVLIGLRDAADNPADRVEYHDDRPWPAFADGQGSSLELRDPRADNSRPEAWAASEESGPAQWQAYIYSGTNANELAASPTTWNEFVFGLLGAGEVLLDDFSVIESPGGAHKQLLQNGSFENGSNSWRFLGNHRHAEVIVDPANAANHVLHLVTDGDTEHMHNHVETTLTNNLPVTNGRQYEISFRAKWLAGCNKLNTRLYFNRLARTTDLSVPASSGTPGARNSRYETNIGPTFADFRHTPVVPTSANAVTISVTASDPDTVASAKLFYSVNGGPWQNSPLAVNPSPSANLQGTVPAQPSLSVVQFYVEATDGLGAKSTCPAGGTNARALYAVGGQALWPRLHTIRILMTPADVAFMHASTNVMSNERLGCTLIADERRAFYDAGIHLQGSERARDVPLRRGFSLELPAGQWYRGVHDRLTVDPSGGYSGLGGKQDELLLKHAINQAGGLPGMYDDLVQCFAPRSAEDGTALLIQAKYGDVFLDSQYPNGGDGEMYKLELIYYPTTTAGANPQSPKLPQPDSVLGTDLKDLGNDAESYRWTLLKENHVAADNYAPMMALAQAFSLSGPALDGQMRQLMDVEEWLRAVAFISLIGGGDIYTYGNSHNFIIYFRPGDHKAMAFLWDMDFSFVAPINQPFPGAGSANTYKLITTIPDNLRRYYWHLLDLSEVTGNSAYLGRWASHYAGLLGQNWGGVVNFLAQRAAYVRGQLPTNAPFAITSNGGNNFAVTNSPVTLAGTAPLTVKDLLVNGVAYPVAWTSVTNWSVVVPLPGVTNFLSVEGVDKHGHPVLNAFDTITVTNYGLLAPAPVVINEWMASNGGPGGYADPLDGGFQDWFELFNPNFVSADISGFYLTDNLSLPSTWQIPPGTVIPARGFLLVWADDQVAQNAVDTNGNLHAKFQLNAGGEAIGLYSASLVPQHLITFGAQTENISQGLYPDGDTNAVYSMPNWTPRRANQIGAPPGPVIGDPGLSPDGNISFNIPAIPGRAYRIEFKNDLGAPGWSPLSTNRATDMTISVSIAPADGPQRFYRAVLLP
jgi:hypothetical protein